MIGVTRTIIATTGTEGKRTEETIAIVDTRIVMIDVTTGEAIHIIEEVEAAKEESSMLATDMKTRICAN